MRLIDADLLKDAIEKEKGDNDYMCRLCLESTKEIIDEQPTAFDVDKVIEQMEHKIANFDCKSCRYRDINCEICNKDCGDALIDDLLDIVKGGGVDGN